MVMKRLIAVTGAAIAFLCAASAVTADPRDSVDRGNALDRDAIRDDVRIHRLTVPTHPLSAEQSQQPLQPAPSSKAKAKSKRSGDIR
jgi:hypothetical protein